MFGLRLGSLCGLELLENLTTRPTAAQRRRVASEVFDFFLHLLDGYLVVRDERLEMLHAAQSSFFDLDALLRRFLCCKACLRALLRGGCQDMSGCTYDHSLEEADVALS